MKSLHITKAIATGAAVSFLAGGMSLAAVGSAGAATTSGVSAKACNNNFQSGPNNSSGTLQTPGGAYRKGPGENYCSFGNRAGLAYIHCTKRSAAGNPWYLARDASSGVVGWIWSGNVSSTSGSIRKC